MQAILIKLPIYLVEALDEARKQLPVPAPRTAVIEAAIREWLDRWKYNSRKIPATKPADAVNQVITSAIDPPSTPSPPVPSDRPFRPVPKSKKKP